MNFILTNHFAIFVSIGGYDDDYSDQDDFGAENNYNVELGAANCEHNMSIDPIGIMDIELFSTYQLLSCQ